MSKKNKKHTTDFNDEPFLLSPEFEAPTGWGKRFADWWQKYFKSVILPAIIVVLIAGGIYAYTNRQQTPAEIGDETQETANQNSEDNLNLNDQSLNTDNINGQDQATPDDGTLAIGEDQSNDATDNTGDSVISPTPGTPTPEIQGQNVSQKVIKGDGLTHLARRALKQYLIQERPNVKLSVEQKIYCEDYIQKHSQGNIGQAGLSIGQDITFNTSLLDTAITKAQGLSDNQLKNLSRYVPLVPSL